MSGLGRELARAVLLFSIVSILFCSNGKQISAAERALLKSDEIVVTKEVLEKN